MQFEPTIDQKVALESILTWYQNPSHAYLTLGGYAGTGKTHLIAALRQILYKLNPKLVITFCAYTGKASRVLDNTLENQNSKKPNDHVSTIHSLIYAPVLDDQGSVSSWKRRSSLKSDLIMVDEASMIDREIWEDLMSFGLPILAVGDHGQLPPIRAGFNLMIRPDIRLETIHRQAVGNPIIQLSMLARNEGKIPIGNFGSGARKLDRYDPQTGDEVEQVLGSIGNETLILAGYNSSRIQLNKQVRILRGRETDIPQAGDRVICLKNNRNKAIYNGMVGIIKKIADSPISQGSDCYEAEISLEDGTVHYSGLIVKRQFNYPVLLSGELRGRNESDLFDFGYALTVHKAQGSQAKKVLLFEERNKHMSDEDWRRWLYTGITRAEAELTIVGI